MSEPSLRLFVAGFAATRSCKYLTVVGDAEQERNSSSAMSDKTVLMIRSVEDSLAHWCAGRFEWWNGSHWSMVHQ